MKFTDGFWLMRKGVSAKYALHPHRIQHEQESVKVLAATKTINHRGDVLNAPTLTMFMDSPLADVIRIKVQHHGGGKSPIKFDLDEHSPKTSFVENETSAEFTAGALTAKLHKGKKWNLEFIAGGKVVTSQREKSFASIDNSDGKHYISVQVGLGVGESVYGLGERFTSFIKNGQSVDIYNEDGGTSSEQAYKNIPFYLTNAGYGVFINHAGRVSLEVASETVERVQFSVEGEEVEYMIIYGPTPKEILKKYTALTGRAPVLPHWSFGLWLSTSFVTDYDEATVTSFIDEMKNRDIPLSVFHFDCYWMREFEWSNFQWDPRVFPDPAGMLKRLKAQGLHISVWINSYIAQESPLFTEGKEHGYLLKRPDGSVWQWDLWQAGLAVVDFTNPGARDWYKSKLRALIDMGVDAFKTDFGERIPTDVVYFDNSHPGDMHNYYTLLYNQTVFELLQERNPKNAIVFARSATVGGQKYPVHWGGDNSSSFESMAETLRGGLSLGLSGFGYWSHDIGGFEGTPDPSVFKRWLPFGLLSSHSRLHGNESVRVPWIFDEEAVDVTRKFTKLKASLMPYLYSAAHEANELGLPMARAMLIEFPEDRTCHFLDQQYMFGSSLLVAPVFSESGEVEFYLPKGTWTNFFTGTQIVGPLWVKETHGFDSLPLYVREKSVIALGRDDTFDYDYHSATDIRGYGLAKGESASTIIYSHSNEKTKTVTVTG
jgi:alpha-D-xyloside xylohydrolase